MFKICSLYEYVLKIGLYENQTCLCVYIYNIRIKYWIRSLNNSIMTEKNWNKKFTQNIRRQIVFKIKKDYHVIIYIYV